MRSLIISALLGVVLGAGLFTAVTFFTAAYVETPELVAKQVVTKTVTETMTTAEELAAPSTTVAKEYGAEEAKQIVTTPIDFLLLSITASSIAVAGAAYIIARQRMHSR
ncbi:MAG: hypothetical protein NXY59_05600 [Aigarchaeota archaeon]|nr:hypothetical protein [Candidatus Pelearchaeum maunauluense]